MLGHYVVEERSYTWFSKFWVGHANKNFKATSKNLFLSFYISKLLVFDLKRGLTRCSNSKSILIKMTTKLTRTKCNLCSLISFKYSAWSLIVIAIFAFGSAFSNCFFVKDPSVTWSSVEESSHLLGWCANVNGWHIWKVVIVCLFETNFVIWLLRLHTWVGFWFLC
jgi:hypothetical protein